jgi:dTDP-glucose pyrophosphorylase
MLSIKELGGKVLNIVIPMAGAGSRFAKVGYKEPKPLIPVHGVPMVRLVIENLRPSTPHRFIFICRSEHLLSFDLESKLKSWAGNNAVVLNVDHLTQGAACTVLLAKDLINSSDRLMIANCDQYVDISIDDYLADMDNRNLDGLIMTLLADDPKWSYVAVNEVGHVTKCVEKKVISINATVGIYNYRNGADFISAAEAMIEKDLRVNNEFYVAPVYNELITEGKKYGIYNVGTEGDGMYGLGIPSDLEFFLTHPISSDAKRALLK